MGQPTIDYGATFDLAKGDFLVAGDKINFHVSFDFTDGMTREQFAERNRRHHEGTVVQKNGRILMPSCGII